MDEAGKGVGGVPIVARTVSSDERHRAARLLDAAFAAAADPGAVVETVTSAADGTFGFRRIRASGPWVFEARPAAPRVGSTQQLWFDRMPGAAQEVRLLVREGSPLRLRVVDATGAGRRAFVSARGPTGKSVPRPWYQRETPTDADGRLTLPAVPHPDVSLTVRVPHLARRAGILVATPAGGEVEVRIGERDGARVTGRVLDSEGAPIAGARVLVMITENAKMYWEGERTDAMATSAPDGTYAVSGLPALYFHSLSADAPGYCARTITRLDEKLAAGGTATADVVLLKAGVVHGRVHTAEGAPIANARVSVAGTPSLDEGRFLLADTSDAEGRYRIEGVPPGALTLTAHVEGHFLAELLPARFGRAARGVAVTLEKEGVVVEKDLVLSPGLPVRGRVVDESGRPAGGAVITASATATRPTGLIRVPIPRAKADSDGHFAFVGLTPSPDWTFQARAGGRCSAWSPAIALTDGQAEPVVLDLTVRPGATLAGRVLDEEDRPVPEVTVGIQPPHSARSVPSDAEGRFAFRGLPAGTYQIHVYRRQWMEQRPAPFEVTLEWGEESTDTVLRAGAGLRIAGIVIDEAGKPVPGRPIWLQAVGRQGRGSSLYVQSGTDGTFEALVAAPGRYALRIEGLEELTEVEAGDENVRIRLPASVLAALEGVVLGPDGEPVPRASLLLQWPVPGGGTRGEIVTVQEGRFRQEVPGGQGISLELQGANDRAGRPLNLRLTKMEGLDAGDSPLTIRLEEGHVVAGRVVDAAGNGVGGVRVSMGYGSLHFMPTPFGPVGITGEDGSFRIVGLDAEPGNLTVQPGPAYAPPPPLSVVPSAEDVVVRLEAASRLEGRVVGPNEEPVVGARIYAGWETEGGGHQRSQTATGADGTFRLDGLGAQPLSIQVSAPQGLTGRWDYIRTRVRDVDPTRTDLVIRLERGLWIEGIVVGPDGAPAKEGSVSADNGQRGVDWRSQRGNVGPDGRFVVGPLSPGSWRLTARAPDPRVRPSEPLRAEAPAEGIRLVLRPAWVIEGCLRGSDVGGFQVTLHRPLADGNHQSIGNRSDPEGLFVFGGLEEGTTGRLHAWRKGDDRYGLLEDVRAGGGTYQVDLQSGRTITGRIEGALPEGEARITIRAHGPHDLSVSTDVRPDDRRAFAFRGLVPGTWRISGHVWGPGGRTRLEPVSAEAGATNVVLRAVAR